MFGARQLSLTVIRNRLLRDAQHRADPNLEILSLLLLLLWPRRIRIDATLDLRQALLVIMHHLRYGNNAADDDGHDRHKQTAQAEDPIQNMIHANPPQLWLQATNWWS
jgi:hypothetical protein